MNLNRRHIVEFERLYRDYFAKMKRFALEYVDNEEDAENLVQDVFVGLWENNNLLTSHPNIFSFLFTAVKNRCIDHLRHKVVVRKRADQIEREYIEMVQMKSDSLLFLNDSVFFEPDIELIVQEAINKLPQKCRQIFVMNKLEGRKQKEIAQELNISLNTVESQMGIAYKKLRVMLKKYLT